MKAVNPYLNFDGNTEEAFKFYQSIFGGELETLRYKDFANNSMEVSEADMDKIAHIALPLGKDNMLMGTDILPALGQKLIVGNNTYITITTDTREEAERYFNALAEGGKVEMPLEETEWAEAYGIVADRYGVQWMFDYSGNKEFQPE